MWVFCCGMYRSGSTLQYQIAVDLVTRRGLGKGHGYVGPDEFKALAQNHAEEEGFQVVKTHKFIPGAEQLLQANKAKALYSYRDIRDVVTSLMQMQQAGFAHFIDNGFVYAALKGYEDWTRFSNIHISRYEDLVVDLPGEVYRIAEYLDLSIEKEEAQDIATEYSLERQKERIRELKPDQMREKTAGIKVDPSTQLHKTHITSGEIGKWRGALSTYEVALVEHIARQWMKKCGYSFSQSWFRRRMSGLCEYARQSIRTMLPS